MGELVRLHNAVVIDQEFISQLWYYLNTLSDPEVINGNLSDFTLIQQGAAEHCCALAIKMAEQDCGLGDSVIDQDRKALEEWLIPVKAYLEENETRQEGIDS